MEPPPGSSLYEACTPDGRPAEWILFYPPEELGRRQRDSNYKMVGYYAKNPKYTDPPSGRAVGVFPWDAELNRNATGRQRASQNAGTQAQASHPLVPVPAETSTSPSSNATPSSFIHYPSPQNPAHAPTATSSAHTPIPSPLLSSPPSQSRPIPEEIMSLVKEIKNLPRSKGFFSSEFASRVDLKGERFQKYFTKAGKLKQKDNELWEFRYDKRLFSEDEWDFFLGLH